MRVYQLWLLNDPSVVPSQNVKTELQCWFRTDEGCVRETRDSAFANRELRSIQQANPTLRYELRTWGDE
jgi:hypothetical protein